MNMLKKALCILLCTIMLISVIPAGAFNAIQTDNNVSAAQAAGTNSDPVKTVFTVFKILLEKLIYYIKLIVNLLRQLIGLDNRLTVSFETQGGSEISPVKVPKGGTLAEVPTPVRQGFAFTGWYLDEALTEPFYSDAPIQKSITLYASYTERDPDLEEFGDRTGYELPEGPYDTVAGYLMALLGRVPEVGDSLVVQLDLEGARGVGVRAHGAVKTATTFISMCP